MTNFQEKISKVREGFGLSRRAFGELLGVPESKIQKIEIGAQRADHEFLANFAEKTDVDLNWLLRSKHSPGTAGPAGFAEGITPAFVGNSEGRADGFFPVTLIDPSKDAKAATCGLSQTWLAKNSLTAEVLRAVRVAGDSMVPDLAEGDHAIFDTTQTDMRDGVTYVFAMGEDILVKRLQILPLRHVNLCSSNNTYAPILVELGKGELRILGRVVASFHGW